jgi:hypothetical protein
MHPARGLPFVPGEQDGPVKGHAAGNIGPRGTAGFPDRRLRPGGQRPPHRRKGGVVIIASIRVHESMEPAPGEQPVNVVCATRRVGSCAAWWEFCRVRREGGVRPDPAVPRVRARNPSPSGRCQYSPLTWGNDWGTLGLSPADPPFPRDGPKELQSSSKNEGGHCIQGPAAVALVHPPGPGCLTQPAAGPATIVPAWQHPRCTGGLRMELPDPAGSYI